MSLARGGKLGPYDILAPLGAGGRGEAYCARDTKLGRDVFATRDCILRRSGLGYRSGGSFIMEIPAQM